MVAKKITITLTNEREQGFNAIWKRLPHLEGSHSATIDYLITRYLDGRPFEPQQPVTDRTVKEVESVTVKEGEDSSPLGEDVF